jgi:hypothetical protein
MNALLAMIEIAGDVRARLAVLGDVFADFLDDESGCIAHGVEIEGQRYFVKHVVSSRGVEAQARAMAVHAAVRHPTLVPLLHTIMGGQGPISIYPWIDGVRLRQSRLTAKLPISSLRHALGAIIDVHAAIERAGFVSIDFYDGNLLYSDRIHLIDVDEYQPSPFTLSNDRTPGSTRFMAPEEFCRGAILDSRTMVFHLGRAAAILIDPPTGTNLDRMRAVIPLVEQATKPEPDKRYQTAAEFAVAWNRIRK